LGKYRVYLLKLGIRQPFRVNTGSNRIDPVFTLMGCLIPSFNRIDIVFTLMGCLIPSFNRIDPVFTLMGCLIPSFNRMGKYRVYTVKAWYKTAH
jgi:hypothetical protein